jgi:hypothetical protein
MVAKEKMELPLEDFDKELVWGGLLPRQRDGARAVVRIVRHVVKALQCACFSSCIHGLLHDLSPLRKN